MNFWQRSRPLSAVEMVPLAGICLALVLAAAPLYGQVAVWITALFLVAIGARIYLNRRAARLPSLPLKVVLFGLGATTIGMSYGSMIGIAPGLSILLVLVSLKVIETNGERDFQVLTVLGYFLALCTLFFSQTLLIWIYVGAVITLLTAMLVRFHAGPGPRSLRKSFKVSGVLLLQALPIIALLFLLFPRTGAFFRFQFGRSLLGTSGISDRLSPGSVASLALNSDIAFRASFPDRNAPPLSQMYWRGVVLWHGNGMTWVTNPQLPVEGRRGTLTGDPIRQNIHLQAHGGRWLFALDRPTSNSEKYDYYPGGYLQRPQLIFNTFYYEVTSRPNNQQTRLLREHRDAALKFGGSVSPRVRKLVDSWLDEGVRVPAPSGLVEGTTPAFDFGFSALGLQLAGKLPRPDFRQYAQGRVADLWPRAGDPPYPWMRTKGTQELVERALQYFRTEKFSYSLEPGTYGDDALDDFLFERRVGFCEHYAASFATLMRVAGVPARVVVGYLGGEHNRTGLGDYVIVRQSDAHAWAEVWFAGLGWKRVDPTEVIAPERISSGLASYLQSQSIAGEESAASDSTVAVGWREMMREAQLAWDSVNHYWELRVLNFDEENQRSFLGFIGFGKSSWLEVLTWAALGIVLSLGVIALWMRRPRRRRTDEASRAWGDFCQRLATLGIRRTPSEGPITFGERAASALNPHASEIRSIARLYADLRYSPEPPAPELFVQAVRKLPKLKARTHQETAKTEDSRTTK